MKVERKGSGYVMEPETGLEHILCAALADGLPAVQVVHRDANGVPLCADGVPYEVYLRTLKEGKDPSAGCIPERFALSGGREILGFP